MTIDPLVRLDGATVIYGSADTARTALADVHLEVYPGEQVAIVGSSGSGKSTLLHVLGGLLPLTRGTVTWPAIPEPRRHPASVAIVFQAPSLITALTVIENVELPLLLSGRDAAVARQRAHEALATLDLAALGDRLPEELSGGQAQRVAVARVLATGPALIVADEPTGQLDATNGALVVDALIHAADEHSAGLVIATHDPRVWERLPLRFRVADGHVHHDSPDFRLAGRR